MDWSMNECVLTVNVFAVACSIEMEIKPFSNNTDVLASPCGVLMVL